MKNLMSCLVFLLVLSNGYAAKVVSASSGFPVAYVNIGVPGMNVGTVSDEQGNFTFIPAGIPDNAVVKLSCIGYEPVEIIFSEFKKLNHITLKEKAYALPEAIVLPSSFVKKKLGVTTKSKAAQAGFQNNELGYEMGIMMKARKRSRINSLQLNIATSGYDSLFYRVNVYEVRNMAKREFVNVLQKPVYLTISKKQQGSAIIFDILPYQIMVSGNFLVTIEHVKNLGAGHLYFCSKIGTNTWYRKTSQGKWEKAPIGISVSVEAMVER